MPTTLGIGTARRRNNNLRRLNLCFSNFIQPFAPESPHTTPTSSSHDIDDHSRPSSTTATANATSSIIIKNFNTLYDQTLTLQYSPLYPFEPEPETETEPADFATAFASQRFFFSSPGRSNSIVESANTDTDFTPPSSTSSYSSLMATVPPPADEPSTSHNNNLHNNNKNDKPFLNGTVAVPTYSPDPYMDFRRSMQEMVEARPELLRDVKSNWEALHELLLCYLALNPKSTHNLILRAFSDLLVSLMSFSSSSSSASSSSSNPPPPQNPNHGGGGGGGI